MDLLRRIGRLITGHYVWVDDAGNEGSTHEPWNIRWALDGIHSYRWNWVRKYGTLSCGCTRNPLTRQMVLFAVPCSDHGMPSFVDE